MRVLLVEDDDMIGNAIQQALREASYGVDWVVDGDAALDSLACNPYQMVLLDLGLPRRDGMSVLHTLRAAGRGVGWMVSKAP